MKIPISYALFFPKRHFAKTDNLDLCATTLEFKKPDFVRFRALNIIFSILSTKEYAKNIVFNAANEVLVEAFLSEKIQYLQIVKYIELTVTELRFLPAKTIKDVIDIDNRTRAYIEQRFF